MNSSTFAESALVVRSSAAAINFLTLISSSMRLGCFVFILGGSFHAQAAAETLSYIDCVTHCQEMLAQVQFTGQVDGERL